MSVNIEKIMLDEKLEHWRKHQQSRRKLKFAKKDSSCLVLINNNFVPAHLKIINNPEDKAIHITCESMRTIFYQSLKIPLELVRGYNREHENILLTLKEEEEPVILKFGNADALEAAFVTLEAFLSETINLPTPPSSSSSSSGSDDSDM